MLLRALARLVALLPFPGLAGPGALLGWLAGSVLRIRRARVEAAMVRAGIEAPRATARAMYASLGRAALEVLWLAGASRAQRASAVEAAARFDDALVDAIDAALARGPLVLAVSHTDNWELAAGAAARLFARRGRAFAIVAKRLSAGAFDAFCTHLRARLGVGRIAPDGALRAAAASLASGGVVAMPIDQVPDRARHGVRLPFLGAPALVDRAPATLARRCGATLLVVGARRDGAVQRLSLLAAPSIACASGPTRDAVRRVTREATAALDAFVRREPSAWLWLHRRWNEPRAAACPARASRLTNRPA